MKLLKNPLNVIELIYFLGIVPKNNNFANKSGSLGMLKLLKIVCKAIFNSQQNNVYTLAKAVLYTPIL